MSQINENEISDELEYLETLRRSGVTNMYGAAPYLKSQFGHDIVRCREILCYWMDNYDRLSEERGW